MTVAPRLEKKHADLRRRWEIWCTISSMVQADKVEDDFCQKTTRTFVSTSRYAVGSVFQTQRWRESLGPWNLPWTAAKSDFHLMILVGFIASFAAIGNLVEVERGHLSVWTSLGSNLWRRSVHALQCYATKQLALKPVTLCLWYSPLSYHAEVRKIDPWKDVLGTGLKAAPFIMLGFSDLGVGGFRISRPPTWISADLEVFGYEDTWQQIQGKFPAWVKDHRMKRVVTLEIFKGSPSRLPKLGWWSTWSKKFNIGTILQRDRKNNDISKRLGFPNISNLKRLHWMGFLMRANVQTSNLKCTTKDYCNHCFPTVDGIGCLSAFLLVVLHASESSLCLSFMSLGDIALVTLCEMSGECQPKGIW